MTSSAPAREALRGLAGESAARESRLALTAVSKSFGPVQAVSNVGFEVLAGEVHGLIGENGAGKSTLMAIASGALRPDTGTVAVNGTMIDADPSLSRSLGLAIVRQHPALFSELTVADNLLLGITEEERRTIKNPVAWARECLANWDDRPDIDPRARVSTLNPEQKFVIEISRALHQRPTVLVLDEPSEHLGAEGVERLFTAIRKLASEGAGIVYISHRVREIREVSDRVTVLRDGANRGTRITAELDDEEIVGLIVGRSLEATFPPKRAGEGPDEGAANLVVSGFSGPRFNNVDLQIKSGEIVGLAGIDGNGQEQIARALAGLERSSGRVSLGGAPVNVRSTRSAVRSGIVYIPADRHEEGVFPILSVRDNVMVRALSRVSTAGFVSARRETRTSAEALAKYAVKASSPSASISSLSGGNQQKVVMAGALLTQPSLVIADQPTQGVDVGAKAEIYAHLRAIADGGSSVLVLSSDNTELAGICDSVHVVSRGSIVSSLDGDDVNERKITDAVLRAESRREHSRREPSRWGRIVNHDLAPVPVLALLIVGLALFTQTQNVNYLSEFNLRSVLHLASVLAVVGLAQGLVLIRGGIDLSVGPVMSMVLVIGSFYVVDGVPAGYHVLGWVLILLFCLAVGVTNWALIDRLQVHPVLATFGTWTLLEAVALLLRPTPGGAISRAVYDLLAMKFGIVPLALLVAVVVMAGLEWWRTRSQSGRALRAAGSDSLTAASVGISLSRTALLAYVGGALLAGLAGILLMGRAGTGDPTAGSLYTLQSVAVAVVGGMSLFGGRGSFIGVVFAAVLLTQVRTITTFLQLSDAWQNILLAIVTVAAVFVYSIVRRTRS